MALTFIRCCHAIIVLLIFQNVFYLKKKHFIMCYFPFEISVLKYCSLFQFVRVIWFVWFVWFDLDVGDVGSSRCGMLGMWDVQDVGYEMWDVCRDVGCWFTKCHSWLRSLAHTFRKVWSTSTLKISATAPTFLEL